MLSSNCKIRWKKFLIWAAIPLIAWYISSNWFQLMLIQGRSMSPAYEHLQLVMLNRYNREFQKGDVIAFYCNNLSSVLVKRVIACPGDTAQIVDGTLIVNNQISHVFSDEGVFSYSGILAEVVQLDSEQYLVIGDNLLESKDSRYWEVGIVFEADIYGKVCKSVK